MSKKDNDQDILGELCAETGFTRAQAQTLAIRQSLALQRYFGRQEAKGVVRVKRGGGQFDPTFERMIRASAHGCRVHSFQPPGWLKGQLDDPPEDLEQLGQMLIRKILDGTHSLSNPELKELVQRILALPGSAEMVKKLVNADLMTQLLKAATTDHQQVEGEAPYGW